ncbi:MAG: VapC toxin family PIN domain ribonuclease [Nitrococcus sp.]|nr:VapC toxin family PIN domain ribonuclease [Nitrococcus sp.]
MKPALLDVNVLIALLDAGHIHHTSAAAWLKVHIRDGWASCPITQNGCIRILSQPAYPNPLSPVRVADRLRKATETPHHTFWPDDISLLENGVTAWDAVLGCKQITDVYLLALAVRHGGRFATFERSVPLRAAPGAKPDHLIVI